MEQFPELARFRSSVVASVNQEFAEWRAPLSSGDEVAFLPPVSGGAVSAGATIERTCARWSGKPMRHRKLLRS